MIDAPHLNQSQKAMLAALRGDSSKEARAKGASWTYFSYALMVLRYAAEEADNVLNGRITLDAAHKLAQTRRDQGVAANPNVGHVHQSTVERRQRDERIRRMAEEGYAEDAIASVVGVGVAHVRVVMHRLGMQTLKEKLGVSRKLDSDKTMSKLVEHAQPPSTAIAAIDWDQLDSSRFWEWERQLSSAIKEWSALRKRLRRAINDERRTAPAASVILAVDSTGRPDGPPASAA